MRISLLAALMAATTLVPAAAFAQDDTDQVRDIRAVRQAAREQRAQSAPQAQPAAPQVAGAAQGQPNRGQWQRRDGGFDRPVRGQRPEWGQRPDRDPSTAWQRSGNGARPNFDQASGAQRTDWRRSGGDRPTFGRPDRDGDGRPAWQRPNDAGRPYAGRPDRDGDGRQDWQRPNVPAQAANGRLDRGGRPDWQRSDRPNVARPAWNGNQRPEWRDQDERRDWARSGADWRDGGRDRWDARERIQWNRDWRRDGRYDYGRYRAQNRALYRLPRYYAPRTWNYGYRRFGIGFTLNSILFDQSYWIDDPIVYRLPPAYGPYRWVRYYNDALLVDVRNGQVVDAIYDIFW